MSNCGVCGSRAKVTTSVYWMISYCRKCGIITVKPLAKEDV